MSLPDTTVHSVLPVVLAEAFSVLPMVSAVALAGSQESGSTDSLSDIDLYIYAESPPPVAARTAIADRFATGTPELDTRFFEPGDVWVHGLTGLTIDIMYRTPAWLEAKLDRALVTHEASVGYSTCFWHNVQHSAILFDRDGWYARTQARAAVPYPAALQRAIVAKNFPLLRDSFSNYHAQIGSALRRQDWLSVQHRLTAYLASYFDILFALHRLPHPGEKRMLETLRRHGDPTLLPPHFAERLDRLVGGGPSPLLLEHLDRLTADLDALIARAVPAVREDEVVTIASAPNVDWHEWQPWVAAPPAVARESEAAAT